MFIMYADVAELVDALASGASASNGVEVQVLSSAPIYGFFRNCRLKWRLFHLYFLILATGKSHFPPPFEKWFLSLHL